MERRLKYILPLIIGAFFIICASAAANWWASSGTQGPGLPVLYTAWDWKYESGLLADQDEDGSDDTYVAFFEGDAAETGRGVLAGVNLVLSERGSPNAATGSPPSRVVSGGAGFTATTGWADGLFTSGQWSIIIKISNMTDGDGTLFKMQGTNGSAQTQSVRIDFSSRRMRLFVYEDGASENSSQTTASIPNSDTEYWVAIWADGTNVVRTGFAIKSPSKLSDFLEYESVATLKGDTFTAGDFDEDDRYFFSDQFGFAAMGMKAYGVVASKLCLIDNAS